MKTNSLVIAIAAAFALVLPVSAASAGVVVSETSMATRLNGATVSEQKTVYVQGDKQKVETQDASIITDLDRSRVYVIDKPNRAYAKVPLQTLSSSAPSTPQTAAVELHRTGRTRVIASRSCSEYRADSGNAIERVSVSACISTSVPASKEISGFERKMEAQLGNHKATQRPDSSGTALMLEKQSVVSFRVPEISPGKRYRTISVMTKTRINQIETKKLSPDIFEPPKDFHELKEPKRGAPTLPSGQTITVADHASHDLAQPGIAGTPEQQAL
jgi:hypothetical protein